MLEKNDSEDQKVFYSIGEVAKLFNVNTSLLRHWEREFPSMISPRKNLNGTRTYSHADIEAIRCVYDLIKVKKLSTAGAHKSLSLNQGRALDISNLKHRLNLVKKELELMRSELTRKS